MNAWARGHGLPTPRLRGAAAARRGGGRHKRAEALANEAAEIAAELIWCCLNGGFSRPFIKVGQGCAARKLL